MLFFFVQHLPDDGRIRPKHAADRLHDCIFDGSHPDVSRNYQNRVVSVKHNLIYPLITIRFATYFDPNSNLTVINHLKPELNPICYLLALLGAHHFLHVSRIRVKLLTLR